MYTRQQYYKYIQQIAMDIHQTIGEDAYNKQVSEYLHSLLDHYPDRVDTDKIAKHIMKILGYDEVPFDEIIDKAEDAIRKQNGGKLPLGAVLQLWQLRQKYGNKDGGDKS